MLVLQLLILSIALLSRTAQALDEHVPEDLVVHKWTPIKAPANPLVKLLNIRTVEARQSTCPAGLGECRNNGGCCVLGGQCCDNGCCDAGFYCDALSGGCCKNGEVCLGTSSSNPCLSAGYSPCSGETFCCPTGNACFRDSNNNPRCQASESQIATSITTRQPKTISVTSTTDPSFTPDISSIPPTSFTDTETSSAVVKSSSVSSARTTPTFNSLPASSTTEIGIQGLVSFGYTVNPILFWNNIPYFLVIVIGATFVPML